MQQPSAEKQQNRLLPWFVLIMGGLFLLPTLPYTLLLVFMPIWKPDETSFLSIVFTIIPASICALTIWAMRRSYQALKSPDNRSHEQLPSASIAEFDLPKTRTPIWPWFVIVPGALLVVSAGPGAMMLPIMPVYLAAMSTDSAATPGYVPGLIFVVGYALLIGYTLLLVKAVKALRTKA